MNQSETEQEVSKMLTRRSQDIPNEVARDAVPVRTLSVIRNPTERPPARWRPKLASAAALLVAGGLTFVVLSETDPEDRSDSAASSDEAAPTGATFTWIQPSGAMEPSYQIGDNIEMVAGVGPATLRRGDVIVFEQQVEPLADGQLTAQPQGIENVPCAGDPPCPAEQRGAISLNRVVGLPGETVSSKDGSVLIDGQPIDESAYNQGRPTEGLDVSTELGPDEYFVLGDNRPMSNDSRYRGPVSLSQIIGVALQK